LGLFHEVNPRVMNEVPKPVRHFMMTLWQEHIPGFVVNIFKTIPCRFESPIDVPFCCWKILDIVRIDRLR
jgi:hypothetical protein